MKIQVEKNLLVNLMTKAHSVVEKRGPMQVLFHILLEAQDGKLRIFATDLEVSLTEEISVQVFEPGRACVNIRNFFEIIKELSEGSVQITRSQNYWVNITQNKAVLNMVGINPDEYPVFPRYKTRDFLVIETRLLKEMIEKTIYSVAIDETRYHLNGIFFIKQIEKDHIKYRMVATDGYRLSLIDRTCIDSLAHKTGTQSIIIPRKGLHEVKKLLDNSEDRVEMAVEGPQFIIKSGSATIMVRLIEGKYPNYQRLIPQDPKKKILVNRNLLLNSLKRISLLSNVNSKGVTLSFTQGKMEISSNNPELGDANEEIEIEYLGEKVSIAYNARYFLEALQSMNEDMVQIGFDDKLSPCLVHPHQDKSHTCVVMPMRV